MPYSKEEWVIALGDNQWKFFKIIETNSGMYIIPSMSKIGLHLSIHPPNPKSPCFAIHIRDRQFGIDQNIKIDERFLSTEYWTSLLPKILDTFQRGLSPNFDDEQAIFVPPSTFRGLVRGSDASRHVLNISGFFNGKFYTGEVRKLPSLIHRLERIYPRNEVYGNTLGFTTSGRMFVPINSKTILQMRFPEMFQLFNIEGLKKALSDSMTRTLNFLQESTCIDDVLNLAMMQSFMEKLRNEISSFNIQIENF